MTFNETKVRRGQPDNKGQFRDKGHSEPEARLSMPEPDEVVGKWRLYGEPSDGTGRIVARKFDHRDDDTPSQELTTRAILFPIGWRVGSLEWTATAPQAVQAAARRIVRSWPGGDRAGASGPAAAVTASPGENFTSVMIHNSRSGIRDIERKVLHTTAGGQYVVVDNRGEDCGKRAPYTVFHVGTGRSVPTVGSRAEFTTQRINKEFAQAFEDAGLFGDGGQPAKGRDPANWVRNWLPA